MNTDFENLTTALRTSAREERRAQSRRAVLTVLVVIPLAVAVLYGLVMLLTLIPA